MSSFVNIFNLTFNSNLTLSSNFKLEPAKVKLSKQNLLLPYEDEGDKQRAYAVSTDLLTETASLVSPPPPFDNSILDMESLCTNVKSYLINTKIGSKTLIERWMKVVEGAKARAKDLPQDKRPLLPKFWIVGSTAMKELGEENRNRIFSHANVDLLNTDYVKANLNKESNDLDTRAIPSVPSWDENQKMLIDFLFAATSQEQRDAYYKTEWGVLEQLISILGFVVIPTLGEYFLVRHKELDQVIGTPQVPYLAKSSNLWLEIDAESLTLDGENLAIKVVCANNAHPVEALIHKSYGYFDTDPGIKNYTAPLVYSSSKALNKRTTSESKFEELLLTLLTHWRNKKSDSIESTLRNVVRAHHKNVDEALAIVLLDLERKILSSPLLENFPTIHLTLFQSIWKQAFIKKERAGCSLLDTILRLRLDHQCSSEVICAFLTIRGVGYLSMPKEGMKYDEIEVMYTLQDGVPSVQYKLCADEFLHLPLSIENACKTIENYYLSNQKKIPEEVATLVADWMKPICSVDLFGGFGLSRFKEFHSKISTDYSSVKTNLQTLVESKIPCLTLCAAFALIAYGEVGQSEAIKDFFTNIAPLLQDDIKDFLTQKILCSHSLEKQWGLIQHETVRKHVPHALAATRKIEFCRLAIEIQQKTVSKNLFQLLLDADGATALDYLDKIKEEPKAEELCEILIALCFQKISKEILKTKFEILYAMAPQNQWVIDFCLSDRKDLIPDLLSKVKENKISIKSETLFKCCVMALSFAQVDRLMLIEILEKESHSLAPFSERCKKEILLPIAVELLSSEDIFLVEAGKKIKGELKEKLSTDILKPLTEISFKAHYRLVILEKMIERNEHTEAVKKLFKLVSMTLDVKAKERLKKALHTLIHQLIAVLADHGKLELLMSILSNPHFSGYDLLWNKVWEGCCTLINLCELKKAPPENVSGSIIFILQIALHWLKEEKNISKAEWKKAYAPLAILFSTIQHQTPLNFNSIHILYNAICAHPQSKGSLFPIEVSGINLIKLFETALTEGFIDLAGLALHKLLTDANALKYIQSAPLDFKRRLVERYMRKEKGEGLSVHLKLTLAWLKSSNRELLGETIWLTCISRWLMDARDNPEKVSKESVEKVLKEWVSSTTHSGDVSQAYKHTSIALLIAEILQQPHYASLQTILTYDSIVTLCCALNIRHPTQRLALQFFSVLGLSKEKPAVMGITQKGFDEEFIPFYLQVFNQLRTQKKTSEAKQIFDALILSVSKTKISISLAYKLLEYIDYLGAEVCSNSTLALLTKLKECMKGPTHYAYWEEATVRFYHSSQAGDKTIISSGVCLLLDRLKGETEGILKKLLKQAGSEAFPIILQLVKKYPDKCSLEIWKEIFVQLNAKKAHQEILECYPIFILFFPFKVGTNPILEETYALLLNVLFEQKSPFLNGFKQVDGQQLEIIALKEGVNRTLRTDLSQILIQRIIEDTFTSEMGSRLWKLRENLLKLNVDIDIFEKNEKLLFNYAFKNNCQFLKEKIIDFNSEKVKKDADEEKLLWNKFFNDFEHWPKEFDQKLFEFLQLLFVKDSDIVMTCYEPVLNWLLQFAQDGKGTLVTLTLFSNFLSQYPEQAKLYHLKKQEFVGKSFGACIRNGYNFVSVSHILNVFYRNQLLSETDFLVTLQALLIQNFNYDLKDAFDLSDAKTKLDCFIEYADKLRDPILHTSCVSVLVRTLAEKEDPSEFYEYVAKILSILDIETENPQYAFVETLYLGITEALFTKLSKNQEIAAYRFLAQLLKYFLKVTPEAKLQSSIHLNIQNIILCISTKLIPYEDKLLLLPLINENPSLRLALEVYLLPEVTIQVKFSEKQILEGLAKLFETLVLVPSSASKTAYTFLHAYSISGRALYNNPTELKALLKTVLDSLSTFEDTYRFLEQLCNENAILGNAFPADVKNVLWEYYLSHIEKLMCFMETPFNEVNPCLEQVLGVFNAFKNVLDFIFPLKGDVSVEAVFVSSKVSTHLLQFMSHCLLNLQIFNGNEFMLSQIILKRIYDLVIIRCVKYANKYGDDLSIFQVLFMKCFRILSALETAGYTNCNWLSGVFINANLLKKPQLLFEHEFLHRDRMYVVNQYLQVRSAERIISDTLSDAELSEDFNFIIKSLECVKLTLLQNNKISSSLKQRHLDFLIRLGAQVLPLQIIEHLADHIIFLNALAYFKDCDNTIHKTLLALLEHCIEVGYSEFIQHAIYKLSEHSYWVVEPLREEKVTFLVKHRVLIFGATSQDLSFEEILVDFLKKVFRENNYELLQKVVSFIYMINESRRPALIRSAITTFLHGNQVIQPFELTNRLNDELTLEDSKNINSAFLKLLYLPQFETDYTGIFSRYLQRTLEYNEVKSLIIKSPPSTITIILLIKRVEQDGDEGKSALQMLQDLLLFSLKFEVQELVNQKALTSQYVDSLKENLKNLDGKIPLNIEMQEVVIEIFNLLWTHCPQNTRDEELIFLTLAFLSREFINKLNEPVKTLTHTSILNHLKVIINDGIKVEKFLNLLEEIFFKHLSQEEMHPLGIEFYFDVGTILLNAKNNNAIKWFNSYVDSHLDHDNNQLPLDIAEKIKVIFEYVLKGKVFYSICNIIPLIEQSLGQKAAKAYFKPIKGVFSSDTFLQIMAQCSGVKWFIDVYQPKAVLQDYLKGKNGKIDCVLAFLAVYTISDPTLWDSVTQLILINSERALEINQEHILKISRQKYFSENTAVQAKFYYALLKVFNSRNTYLELPLNLAVHSFAALGRYTPESFLGEFLKNWSYCKSFNQENLDIILNILLSSPTSNIMDLAVLKHVHRSESFTTYIRGIGLIYRHIKDEDPKIFLQVYALILKSALENYRSGISLPVEFIKVCTLVNREIKNSNKVSTYAYNLPLVLAQFGSNELLEDAFSILHIILDFSTPQALVAEAKRFIEVKDVFLKNMTTACSMDLHVVFAKAEDKGLLTKAEYEDTLLVLVSFMLDSLSANSENASKLSMEWPKAITYISGRKEVFNAIIARKLMKPLVKHCLDVKNETDILCYFVALNAHFSRQSRSNAHTAVEAYPLCIDGYCWNMNKTLALTLMQFDEILNANASDEEDCRLLLLWGYKHLTTAVKNYPHEAEVLAKAAQAFFLAPFISSQAMLERAYSLGMNLISSPAFAPIWEAAPQEGIKMQIISGVLSGKDNLPPTLSSHEFYDIMSGLMHANNPFSMEIACNFVNVLLPRVEDIDKLNLVQKVLYPLLKACTGTGNYVKSLEALLPLIIKHVQINEPSCAMTWNISKMVLNIIVAVLQTQNNNTLGSNANERASLSELAISIFEKFSSLYYSQLKFQDYYTDISSLMNLFSEIKNAPKLIHRIVNLISLNKKVIFISNSEEYNIRQKILKDWCEVILTMQDGNKILRKMLNNPLVISCFGGNPAFIEGLEARIS